MELKVTRYEVAEGVATVTLDRPDRLNAWTARMEAEYLGLLQRAEDDRAVRIVVVTGAGRGFCAGADASALGRIADRGDYDAAAAARAPAGSAPAAPPAAPGLTLHAAMTKPVLAAINGPAAGVGFVLACFCDLRFAAAGAKLTTSFGRLGLPAEHGISWLLPRLVGPAHAADLLFSSRVVLAEEAGAMGLVNRVLPADELLPAALEYARTTAREVSPSSLAVMKRQLWDDLGPGLRSSALASMAHLRRMVAEPDFAEGVAALTEERPPRFT